MSLHHRGALKSSGPVSDRTRRRDRWDSEAWVPAYRSHHTALSVPQGLGSQVETQNNQSQVANQAFSWSQLTYFLCFSIFRMKVSPGAAAPPPATISSSVVLHGVNFGSNKLNKSYYASVYLLTHLKGQTAPS